MSEFENEHTWGKAISGNSTLTLIPTEEHKSELPDLIPDVIPEQKKPLEEPSSENNEEDLDDDNYDDGN